MKQCLARTKKGGRCKNNTILFLCNFHYKKFFNWKTILVSIAGIMIFLGGIGGFFTDFFIPIKENIIQETKQESEKTDYWYCEQDRNIRGIIMPNIQGTIGSDNEIVFLFGFDNPIILPIMIEKPNQSICLFPSLTVFFKDYCSITYKIVESRLSLSADIYDVNGCLAAKIVDNEFVLNKNCEYTWNRDDYGFEIMDSNFDVIFSLNFEPPKRLSVQGVFYDGKYFVVVPEPKYAASDTFRNEHNKIVSYGAIAVGVPKEDIATLNKMKKSLRPLFEYVGKDWFGKRKIY